MKTPVFPAGDSRHLKILSTLGSEPLNQYGQQGLNTESGANLARFKSGLECHQKGFSTEQKNSHYNIIYNSHLRTFIILMLLNLKSSVYIVLHLKKRQLINYGQHYNAKNL